MIRRLRKFILITGTLLSLLIAAAFVVSAWWEFQVRIPRPSGPVIALVAGRVLIVTHEIGTAPVSAVSHSYGLSRWNSWAFRRLGGKMFRGPTINVIEFPLYAVFAAVAIPTLLVWRFGPKPVKPGHCLCGYDLTGNVSGRCPECGVATTPS